MDVTHYLIVGVDPAKAEHGFWAMRYPEQVLLSGKVRNDLPDLERWDSDFQALSERLDLRLVYAVEDGSCYGERLTKLLMSRSRAVKEVNPIKVSRQRDMYGDDKNDLVDARSCAAVALGQIKELPSMPAVSPVYRQIREVSRYLASVSKGHAQNLNRLHRHLTRVWPVAHATWFACLDGLTALKFFTQYRHPRELLGVTDQSLTDFLFEASEHRLGRERGQPGPKAQARAKAEQILGDCAAYREREPGGEERVIAVMIKSLAEGLLQTLKTKKELTSVLEKDLLPQTGQQLQTLVGISVTSEAQLLGEMLAPNRFLNRNAYAKYNGTAGRECSTGKTERHKATKACNRRLKAALHRIAVVNAQHDPLGKTYFLSLIHRGLSKGEAYKRLARRLSDVVFAMIRDRAGYDPEKVKKAIEERKNRGRDGTLQKQSIPARRSSIALSRPSENPTPTAQTVSSQEC